MKTLILTPGEQNIIDPNNLDEEFAHPTNGKKVTARQLLDLLRTKVNPLPDIFPALKGYSPFVPEVGEIVTLALAINTPTKTIPNVAFKINPKLPLDQQVLQFGNTTLDAHWVLEELTNKYVLNPTTTPTTFKVGENYLLDTNFAHLTIQFDEDIKIFNSMVPNRNADILSFVSTYQTSPGFKWEPLMPGEAYQIDNQYICVTTPLVTWARKKTQLSDEENEFRIGVATRIVGKGTNIVYKLLTVKKDEHGKQQLSDTHPRVFKYGVNLSEDGIQDFKNEAMHGETAGLHTKDVYANPKRKTAILVERHFKGPSLFAVLKEHQVQFTAEQILIISYLLAKTLRAQFHDKGLIHRDIKPENIIMLGLDLEAAKKNPASIDMSKIHFVYIDTGFTTTLDKARINANRGTPEFVAPDGISDDDINDQKSDVFSLGITLLELIGAPRRKYKISDAGIEISPVNLNDPKLFQNMPNADIKKEMLDIIGNSINPVRSKRATSSILEDKLDLLLFKYQHADRIQITRSELSKLDNEDIQAYADRIRAQLHHHIEVNSELDVSKIGIMVNTTLFHLLTSKEAMHNKVDDVLDKFNANYAAFLEYKEFLINTQTNPSIRITFPARDLEKLINTFQNIAYAKNIDSLNEFNIAFQRNEVSLLQFRTQIERLLQSSPLVNQGNSSADIESSRVDSTLSHSINIHRPTNIHSQTASSNVSQHSHPAYSTTNNRGIEARSFSEEDESKSETSIRAILSENLDAISMINAEVALEKKLADANIVLDEFPSIKYFKSNLEGDRYARLIQNEKRGTYGLSFKNTTEIFKALTTIISAKGISEFLTKSDSISLLSLNQSITGFLKSNQQIDIKTKNAIENADTVLLNYSLRSSLLLLSQQDTQSAQLKNLREKTLEFSHRLEQLFTEDSTNTIKLFENRTTYQNLIYDIDSVIELFAKKTIDEKEIRKLEKRIEQAQFKSYLYVMSQVLKNNQTLTKEARQEFLNEIIDLENDKNRPNLIAIMDKTITFVDQTSKYPEKTDVKNYFDEAVALAKPMQSNKLMGGICAVAGAALLVLSGIAAIATFAHPHTSFITAPMAYFLADWGAKLVAGTVIGSLVSGAASYFGYSTQTFFNRDTTLVKGIRAINKKMNGEQTSEEKKEVERENDNDKNIGRNSDIEWKKF